MKFRLSYFILSDLRCLLHSFTLTVFFIMATNVCISMACVFTIPTSVFLVPSSGVVYVILALGVSTLVRPPCGSKLVKLKTLLQMPTYLLGHNFMFLYMHKLLFFHFTEFWNYVLTKILCGDVSNFLPASLRWGYSCVKEKWKYIVQ